MAKAFKVLGSPVGHSKSPAIHLAAYRALGLDWEYSRSEVFAGGLDEFLAVDISAGYSVTMPLKAEALAAATAADEVAQLAGVANTLLRTETGFEAFNTDVFGLRRAIGNFDFDGYNLIGSGATARNALIAISESAPGANVRLSARNAQAIVEITGFGAKLGLQMTHQPQLNPGASELTISTVPGSADPRELVSGPAGTLFDVAYSPWPSAVGRLWQQNGGSLVSGINMLVWQAIAQIRIFSNGSVADELPNETDLAAIMLAAAED